jgi:multidrug resistance efflux pump
MYQQALANRDQAPVNLERTQVRSPVNGWVTNLLAQLGDYANVGQNIIFVVDADSFWVDGYFEEINLGSIHEGDPAEIKLRATARSFVAMSAASPAASTSPTRKPTSRGLLR